MDLKILDSAENACFTYIYQMKSKEIKIMDEEE
jgi:hypothetical protein